jgi:flagellar hook-length control protein FliK
MLNAAPPTTIPNVMMLPDPSVPPQQPLTVAASFDAIFAQRVQQAEVLPAAPEPEAMESEYQAPIAPTIAPLPHPLMPAKDETKTVPVEPAEKTAEAKIDIAPPPLVIVQIAPAAPATPSQPEAKADCAPLPLLATAMPSQATAPPRAAEPETTENLAVLSANFSPPALIQTKPNGPENRAKDAFSSLSLAAPMRVKTTSDVSKAVPVEPTMIAVKPAIAQTLSSTPIAFYPLPQSPDITAASPTVIAAQPLDLLHTDRWLNDLSAELAALPTDTNRILFRLSPDNLGQLDIMLNRRDDSFAVELRADCEEAQSMIAQSLPRLEQELRVKVRMPVEAQLASNHQAADQGQRQQHRPDRSPYRAPETIILQPKAADHSSTDRLA